MNAPKFGLANVANENDTKPEIIPLASSPRRAFLEGLSASALLTLLGGCGQPSTESAKKEPSQIEAPRARLRAHAGAVLGLQFGSDGQSLITSGADDKRKTWALPEGRWLRTEAGKSAKGETGATASTADHKFSAMAEPPTRRNIVLRGLSGDHPIADFAGHSSEIRVIIFSPDGKLILSGDEDGVILLWQTEPPAFRSYLFDPGANESPIKANTYMQRDNATGVTLFYTLPCDAPLPAGASCICNCVAGSYKEPSALRQPRRRQPVDEPGEPIRIPEYRVPSERPITLPGRSGTAPCGSPIPPGAVCTCNCI